MKTRKALSFYLVFYVSSHLSNLEKFMIICAFGGLCRVMERFELFKLLGRNRTFWEGSVGSGYGEYWCKMGRIVPRIPKPPSYLYAVQTSPKPKKSKKGILRVRTLYTSNICMYFVEQSYSESMFHHHRTSSAKA